MRMRTPSFASLVRYLDTATSTRLIRPETSSVGRFQFSDENAKTVRYSMPRSAQASTVRTSASTPCLWPKNRGMQRFLAQRPLPSMTIATWRGTLARESAGSLKVAVVFVMIVRRMPSDGHDLRLLGAAQAIDLGDHPVGHALHLLEGAALLVLRDLLVLHQLLGLVVGIATQVADGD